MGTTEKIVVESPSFAGNTDEPLRSKIEFLLQVYGMSHVKYILSLKVTKTPRESPYLSVCPSVYQYVVTSEPPNPFSKNLILGSSTKICRQ